MRRNIIIFMTAIGIILLLSVFLFDHIFPRSYHYTFTKTTDLGKEKH